MAGTVIDLSKYRLDKAKENLSIAKKLYADDALEFAQNRAYYAAFDAMRAVNALDGFDSSKHSGVQAHFNQAHVKTGDFSGNVSKIIKSVAQLREKSDYEDFYIPSKEETEQSINNVKEFVEMIEVYLRSRWESM